MKNGSGFLGGEFSRRRAWASVWTAGEPAVGRGEPRAEGEDGDALRGEARLVGCDPEPHGSTRSASRFPAPGTIEMR